MEALQTNISEIEISYRPSRNSEVLLTSVEQAYQTLYPFFPQDTIALQERFIVAYLNRAHQLLGVYQASRGGMTGTVADLRLIFSTALKIAAVNIIVMHNHPSGQTKPSAQDKILTEKIQHAGGLLDIHLVDHLIVTPSEGMFYSFANEGLLNN